MSSRRNLNSTLLQSSRRTPRNLGSTESLNSLSTTLLSTSSASFATPKSSIFEIPPKEAAYNQYLQAMVKRQLAKNANEKHEKSINSQFKANLMKLVELQQMRGDIQHKLEEIDENAVLTVEVNKIKAVLDHIENICTEQEILIKVREFKAFLEVSMGRVQLKNVKPIESEQQFSELVDQLRNLNPLLKSIVSRQGEEKIMGLSKIASALDEVKRLQKEIDQLTKKITTIKEQSTFFLLEFLSNNFDAKYH